MFVFLCVVSCLKVNKCTLAQSEKMNCVEQWVCTTATVGRGKSAPASLLLVSLPPAMPAQRAETHSVTSRRPTAATMCGCRPACCLNDPRGPDDADDDLCPQCRSPSSCGEFKDCRRLARTTGICREFEQAAEGDFFSHVSQVRWSKRPPAVIITACWVLYAAVCRSKY